MSKIVTANGVYDLSNINNLEELKEEIAFLKNSINKDEELLENHFRSMPRHLLKSTADNILPSFLNKLVANGTWKLLLSGASMFANPFAKGFSFKRNIISSAKRLGLITLIKSGYTFWKKKQSEKSRPAAGFKDPVVTVIKTKSIKRG